MDLKGLHFAILALLALAAIIGGLRACDQNAMALQWQSREAGRKPRRRGRSGAGFARFAPLRLANSAPECPPDAFAGLVNRLPGDPATPGAPFQLPADGWIQLAPLGEFPVTRADGKKVVQVVDGQAVAAMVLNFDRAKPMVVDYDHGSLDTDKSSAAAGWVEGLQARPDGLYGNIRWSNRGKADVEGGAFRFVSPVWTPEADGERVRPARLINVALTNSPNLKTLKPLTNREAAPPHVGGHKISDGAGPSGNQKETMKNLTKLLGLPDDADELAMMNRVKEIQATAAEATALKNRVTSLEAEAVERDLETFTNVIDNKDDVRAQLLANRDGTLKLLNALKKPAAPTATPAQGKVIPLHNRAKSETPDPAKVTATEADKQQAAVLAIKNRDGCTYEQAFNIARAEKPELFAAAQD